MGSLCFAGQAVVNGEEGRLFVAVFTGEQKTSEQIIE